MNMVSTVNPISISPPTKITPVAFLLLPDQGRAFELIDGELVERTVSAESSRTTLEIGRLVGNHCHAHQPAWLFGSDASYRCFPDDPDRIRRADLSVIVYQRMTPSQYKAPGFMSICPDLVVEVISPGNLASEVTRKRVEWLAAGAKLVWVADPEDQSVSVYQPGARPIVYTAEDSLPGEPVLPGFTVPVADLFRLPTPHQIRGEQR